MIRHAALPTPTPGQALRRALRGLSAAAVALAVALPAGPAAAAPTPKHLELVPLEREPEAGREAPTPAALAALNKKVEDEPKDRAARFDLVRAHVAAGDLQAALAAAKAWREVDAYNLVVVRLLGDIYAELGRHAEARRAYSAVVELLPEDASAHRALATVLKQTGDLQGAYERLKIAARHKPDDVRIGFELADAAHRLGRDAEAVERFVAIVAHEDAPQRVRYPAAQRLAQLYTTQRRAALKAGDQAKADALAAQVAALQVKGGAVNDIKVYLTWDTDRSDVDLWVINPRGEKIYYSHKKGRFGGALYDDVTNGYGPESFTAPTARVGTYVIKVNYFATNRRRFTEARGEVVVVLHEGTAQEQRHVLPYRLFRKGQTVTVGKVVVGKPTNGPEGRVEG